MSEEPVAAEDVLSDLLQTLLGMGTDYGDYIEIGERVVFVDEARKLIEAARSHG